MVRRSFTTQDDELMLELIGLTKKRSITGKTYFTVQKGCDFLTLIEFAFKTPSLRAWAIG